MMKISNPCPDLLISCPSNYLALAEIHIDTIHIHFIKLHKFVEKRENRKKDPP